MIKILSLFLCFLLANASNQVSAAVTNYEDLWWAYPPGSESGWGINIAQQSNILFATWFIYGSNGQPVWIVMSDGERISNGVYQGVIYQTTGPAYSASYNSATVTANAVGNATFTFSSMARGTLTYTYNGASVTKNITRQTWSYVNASGQYQSVLKEVQTGCTPSSDNGTYIENRTMVVAGDIAANTLTWTIGADAQHTNTWTLTANNFTQSGSLLMVGSMGGNVTVTDSSKGGAVVFKGIWGTGTAGDLKFGSDLASGQIIMQATDVGNCTIEVTFSGVMTL